MYEEKPGERYRYNDVRDILVRFPAWRSLSCVFEGDRLSRRPYCHSMRKEKLASQVKWPKGEAYHSPTDSAKFTNEWS
jgi:hypothetical protein